MNFDEQKKQKDPLDINTKFILELLNSNKLSEAKNEIDKKLLEHPNSSILFNIKGAVFAAQNHLDEAISNYKKALKINPRYAQAYNNLAIVYQKSNKLKEAEENYKKAINLKSDFAEAYNNLGAVSRDMDKLLDAEKYLKKALKFKSNYAEAYNNLGCTYEDLGDKKKALENFKEAVSINPNYAEVYNNIGSVLSEMIRFEEAIISYKKAIELKPSNEKAYNNFGNLLSNLGKHDEADHLYKQAIKLKPSYSKAYSNLLFNLNYKIDWNYNLYLSEARKYRLNCKTIKKKLSTQYKYEKNPSKINVGFVTADFGNHPGGYFTFSTLKELRKKDFNLFAYSTIDRDDKFSRHFKSLFSKWNLISKKKDFEVIEDILKDGIHILMDLQGHSAQNRLPIFMYKPAPVQATWLGQGSTGIPEIDYFIGSPHITPADEENHYIEKIIRLPEISQCFTIPDFDVEVNDLPALKNNFVTFGCLNKLTKMNDQVVALWSKILNSIPKSKLILKSSEYENQKIVKETIERFEKNKVDKSCLIFMGKSKTRKEVLEVFNKIDIALDPFPFQGNTSTCEAVWMGVPVLTLKGNRYLFHFGESINSNLNLKNWIAKNENEYISKAIKFSSNLEFLSKLRHDLRKNALQSPVFDAPRFAEHFSKILWEMWKKFKLKKK